MKEALAPSDGWSSIQAECQNYFDFEEFNGLVVFFYFFFLFFLGKPWLLVMGGRPFRPNVKIILILKNLMGELFFCFFFFVFLFIFFVKIILILKNLMG